MIKSITYVITTNKNIRCYSCSENCEKFQKEKYIDLETFRNHMKILKNIFSNTFELHFSGGEPLLHKNLEEICEIVHQEFSNNIPIYIHTNGILMKTLKDNQLINLTKNYNVNFLFYLYPISSYLKNYQKQIQRFQSLNIDMYWTHEHLYFNKFTLKRYEDSCEEVLKNNYKLYIADNKIYGLCPSIQNIQSNLIEDNFNYIEIDNLTDINQIYNLFLQTKCTYCKGRSIPLSNLYLDNYKKYELLLDYVYDLGYFLQYEFFYKNIQDSTSTQEFQMILNKFLNGWMDIYIPYSKSQLSYNKILKLKDLLIKQENINKFNLYFISIDDDLETQQMWFETFEPSLMNTYFLKSDSLYLGIKKFFDKSRIPKYYIFDILNLDLLKDSLFLTNLTERKI